MAEHEAQSDIRIQNHRLKPEINLQNTFTHVSKNPVARALQNDNKLR